MQAARCAIFLSLLIAAGGGVWYLQVHIPDRQWRGLEAAGAVAMAEGRFREAERHFTAAAAAAGCFGDHDPRLDQSRRHQAMAQAAMNASPPGRSPSSRPGPIKN